jgi:2-dehydro-3-deoxyphosphogluconate aldolase/(4S)-4-hydroxy-2-oxoglutarate aldolase
MVNTLDQRLQLPGGVLNSRIIAVLRADASTHLVDVAVALEQEGITCIEVTLTTPGALEAIKALRSVLVEGSDLGAGSILSVDDLEAAHAAGATYTLAPSLDLEVISRAQELGIPHVPGAATPTEVLTAWRAGAAAVKVFPASQLGGPGYIKALRGPLPGVRLIPTGGVKAEEIEDYLQAGSIAVGVGSPLTGNALVNGADDAFRKRVRQFTTRFRASNAGDQ